MKYFSLAILALVCASAVVSAAPSPQFDDLIYTPLESIKEKLKEYFEKFQCAGKVIGKAVKDTEYQEDYEQFKRIVDDAVANFKKCSEVDSKKEQFNCAFHALKALPGNFDGFFEKLNQKNKELAKEIAAQVKSECFATQELFAETFAPSIAEEFQCLADTLGEVSKANGLEEQWSRTQPQLQLHIDNLKRCPQAGNKIFVTICKGKEIYTIFKNYIEYMKLVASENPKAILEFVNQIKQKCSGTKAENMFFAEVEDMAISNKVRKVVQKVTCVVKAVDETVLGADLEGALNEVYDLIDSAERLTLCVEQSNKLDAAICVLNEVKVSSEKTIQLLHKLQEVNNTVSTALRGEIEKCLA